MAFAIETRQLSKHYGELPAVKSLQLMIPAGQFHGLLGPNGSGKTTTIHMLCTLTRPDTGTIRIAGINALQHPVKVRQNIGLVFQESALDRSLSVEENLYFAGALYGLADDVIKQRVDELLQLFDLNDKRQTRVAALSGGMRRGLDIARGVLHQPKVLFLDEPTIGLDIINRRNIWRFIKGLRQRLGMTVLLTTHYLEEAQACDQVSFIREGELIGQGQPAALIADLGAYILEIETHTPEQHIEIIQPQLGPPVIDGDRLLFRIPDETFAVSSLQKQLQASVQALHIRKPDLNDVYIWKNLAPGSMNL